MKPYIIPFEQLKNKDVELVGGKNASIGEMISGLAALGVTVPGGFATTSHAYRDFLAQGGLDERIRAVLAALDVDDVERLAVVGAQIAVAVRSSATAEDLPEASFAGQQETFLNVRGADEVIKAVKLVFASLFNDRAISYRVHRTLNHGLAQTIRGGDEHHVVEAGLGVHCEHHTA